MVGDERRSYSFHYSDQQGDLALALNAAADFIYRHIGDDDVVMDISLHDDCVVVYVAWGDDRHAHTRRVPRPE